MTSPRLSADCCYWTLLSFQLRSLSWQPDCVPTLVSLLWLVAASQAAAWAVLSWAPRSVGPAAWSGEHDNMTLISLTEQCQPVSVSAWWHPDLHQVMTARDRDVTHEGRMDRQGSESMTGWQIDTGWETHLALFDSPEPHNLDEGETGSRVPIEIMSCDCIVSVSIAHVCICIVSLLQALFQIVLRSQCRVTTLLTRADISDSGG